MEIMWGLGFSNVRIPFLFYPICIWFRYLDSTVQIHVYPIGIFYSANFETIQVQVLRLIYLVIL